MNKSKVGGAMLNNSCLIKRCLIVSIFIPLLMASFLTAFSLEDDNSNIAYREEKGPGTFSIGENIATVTIGDGLSFISKENCTAYYNSIEDVSSGEELGIIYPSDKKSNWHLVFEFKGEGYIYDDAISLKDDAALLKDIIRRNNNYNIKRKKVGYPQLDILGWDEKPHYDNYLNLLTWSALDQSDGYKFINAEFIILGRNGYMDCRLVFDLNDKEHLKPILKQIIDGFSFKDDSKYSAFNPLKDRISNHSLGGLINGQYNEISNFKLRSLLIVKKQGIYIMSAIILLDIIRRLILHWIRKSKKTNN